MQNEFKDHPANGVIFIERLFINLGYLLAVLVVTDICSGFMSREPDKQAHELLLLYYQPISVVWATLIGFSLLRLQCKYPTRIAIMDICSALVVASIFLGIPYFLQNR
jgi:hypothetical protein